MTFSESSFSALRLFECTLSCCLFKSKLVLSCFSYLDLIPLLFSFNWLIWFYNSLIFSFWCLFILFSCITSLDLSYSFCFSISSEDVFLIEISFKLFFIWPYPLGCFLRLSYKDPFKELLIWELEFLIGDLELNALGVILLDLKLLL